MNFVWQDYEPKTMEYIENWLDEHAVSSTGLDNGFRDFYEYWSNEDGFVIGENFWCKVVFENDKPFAIVSLCLHESKVTIQEIVVAPEKRGQGMGKKLLKELLESEEILGFAIRKSEAVIFPDNIASQKAFNKAGFKVLRTDETSDSLRYYYESDYYGIQ